MNTYEYKGEILTSRELAKLAGMSTSAFTKKINELGWSFDDVMSGQRTHLTVAEAKKHKAAPPVHRHFSRNRKHNR